jgi:nitroreductase
MWAKNAAALVMTLAKTTFERRPGPNHWAMHDAGLALGSLMTQATALGLYSHAMAGFDAAKARSVYDLPDDVVPVAVVAIGHQGDLGQLAETFHDVEVRPRTRRALEDLLIDSQI